MRVPGLAVMWFWRRAVYVPGKHGCPCRQCVQNRSELAQLVKRILEA